MRSRPTPDEDDAAPAYRGDVTTGFASPADGKIEGVVDLAELLSLGRPGLYPVRVVGQALRERGIHDGDILIANAAADPVSGRVCVAFVREEVVLATLGREDDGSWWLKPNAGPSVPVAGDVEVWAMISGLVRLTV